MEKNKIIMALYDVRYKRYRNIWKRIRIFLDDNPFLDAMIWILSFIAFIVVLIVVLNAITDSDIEKTKELYKGKKVYTHIVEIERITGLKDTVIFHDYDSVVDAHFDKSVAKRPVIIRSHGRNIINAETDTDIKFEESINFKILK